MTATVRERRCAPQRSEPSAPPPSGRAARSARRCGAFARAAAMPASEVAQPPPVQSDALRQPAERLIRCTGTARRQGRHRHRGACQPAAAQKRASAPSPPTATAAHPIRRAGNPAAARDRLPVVFRRPTGAPEPGCRRPAAKRTRRREDHRWSDRLRLLAENRAPIRAAMGPQVRGQAPSGMAGPATARAARQPVKLPRDLPGPFCPAIARSEPAGCRNLCGRRARRCPSLRLAQMLAVTSPSTT